MGSCDCGNRDDWSAWHDRMPGSSPTLHVVGTCRCPALGYRLELRYKEPQGSNPNDLLLELVVAEQDGPVPQVVVPVLGSYKLDTEFGYKTVSVVPDGPTGIPVKPVS